MRTWIAMRQAMAAWDLVMRVWGRKLKLNVNELMVIMLLGERSARSAAELAMCSGRRRQHLQDSLHALQARGFVQPSRRNKKGRIQAWALTAHGQQCVEAVQSRAREWEEHLGKRVDLQLLGSLLTRTVEVIVRYPTGGNGWEEALNPPLELIDIDPAAAIEALRREASALHAPDAPAPRVETGDAQGGRDLTTPATSDADAASEAAEWEAVERAIHAMWNGPDCLFSDSSQELAAE